MLTTVPSLTAERETCLLRFSVLPCKAPRGTPVFGAEIEKARANVSPRRKPISRGISAGGGEMMYGYGRCVQWQQEKANKCLANYNVDGCVYLSRNSAMYIIFPFPRARGQF